MTESSEMQPYRLLENSVTANPKQVALSSQRISLTYQELLEAVIAFARYLRHSGLQSGDRIAVRLEPESYLIASLAAMHEGVVLVPYKIGFTDYSGLGCKFLLTDSEGLGIEPISVRVASAKELLELSRQPTQLDIRGFGSDRDIAKVFFTSGTTGRPKPVGVSLQTLLSRRKNYQTVVRPAQRHLTIIGPDILPGFNTFLSCLEQATTYFLPGTAAANLSTITHQEISTVLASPAQIMDLISSSESNHHFPNLSRVQLTGSPLSSAALSKLQQKLKVDIELQYGSTETGSVALTKIKEGNLRDLETVFPWARIEVVDGAGNRVGPGVSGQIRVSSQAAVDAVEIPSFEEVSSSRNGWFYPGDMGHISQTGVIVLEGRSADLLNVGGVKLDPRDIEDFMIAQYGFSETAAILFEGSNGNSSICLAVVGGELPEPAILNASFRARFGIREPLFIMRLTELPKNELGKIQKNQLALMATAASAPS